MLESYDMALAIPSRGFQATWQGATEPLGRCLDYWAISRSMKLLLVETEVEREALARTSHSPVGILLRKPEQGTKEERGSKNRKGMYRKRKWPNWREAAEGQFNPLLRPEAWASLADAERDIQMAGAASAQRTPTTRATPYDAFEFDLVARRKQEKDPYRRKCLQRAIFVVRRQNKVWRSEQAISASTLAGKSLQVVATSHVITGSVTTMCKTEDFRRHWSSMMAEDQVCGTETEHRYASSLRDPVAHPGSIPVDLQSLVQVLRKLKPGRIGGQDGVAAESITALSIEAKQQMTVHIRNVLDGTTQKVGTGLM